MWILNTYQRYIHSLFKIIREFKQSLCERGSIQESSYSRFCKADANNRDKELIDIEFSRYLKYSLAERFTSVMNGIIPQD